jgi:hypothetical protein
MLVWEALAMMYLYSRLLLYSMLKERFEGEVYILHKRGG